MVVDIPLGSTERVQRSFLKLKGVVCESKSWGVSTRVSMLSGRGPLYCGASFLFEVKLCLRVGVIFRSIDKEINNELSM